MGTGWEEFDRLAKLAVSEAEKICPACFGKKVLPGIRRDIGVPCWVCQGKGMVKAQEVAVRKDR